MAEGSGCPHEWLWLTDSKCSNHSNGRLRRFACRKNRLQDVVGKRQRPDRISGRHYHHNGNPEVQESGQATERLADVRIVTARPQDGRAQLRVAQRSNERDYSANGPDDERAANWTNLLKKKRTYNAYNIILIPRTQGVLLLVSILAVAYTRILALMCARIVRSLLSIVHTLGLKIGSV